MASNGLSTNQLISKAKVALMNDPEWRWMAGILMMGNIDIVSGPDEQVQTAATDGLNETYNNEFMQRLQPSEVKAVILHENFHKMFRHLTVWRNLFEENPQGANIACDVVINTQYLYNKPGVTMTKEFVVMQEYADKDVWNAKKVYDDLKQKYGGKGGGKGDGKGSGSGMPASGHDSHQWDKAKQMTEAEQKEIETQVDNALRQAAIAGNIGANMPRSIKEMLVPELDWKSLLADFVKSTCAGRDKTTWRRPHRTYVAYDLYMPANYSETVGRVLIGGDTSGSIGNRALSQFLGYMQQLVNEVDPDGVDVVWWDTSVKGVDKFERGDCSNLVSSVRPVGGGGTTPACVPHWIKENKNDYVCAVMITDGAFYGDGVGDWGDLPVLWLVVNNHPVRNIPTGITIQVKEL